MRCFAVLVPVALVVASFGCSTGTTGRSTSPDDAIDEAQRAEDERFENWRNQLDATRPEPPYEVQALTAFAAPDRCGQGPYRIEMDALSSEFFENFKVYACGPRRVAGNVRLTTVRPRGEPSETEWQFGSSADNDACVARAAERAEGAAGPGVGGASSASEGKAASSRSPAVSVAAEAVALERLDEVPEECEVEVRLVEIVSRHSGRGTHPHLGTTIWDGVRFIVKIWSQEPNDLEGVAFVVRQLGVPEEVTLEQWLAYRDAKAAWDERNSAYWDAMVEAERARRGGSSIRRDTTPPPPPPKEEPVPPRPSDNATWVAGYWHYEGETFHWISGFWRVPERDVREHRTVKAPKPPPPSEPAEESRPPRPSERAVWVPGTWRWDGRAYVWVSGTWRIPPSEAHDWKPSRWIRAEGGVRFVPGGWKIEIRARR